MRYRGIILEKQQQHRYKINIKRSLNKEPTVYSVMIIN